MSGKDWSPDREFARLMIAAAVAAAIAVVGSFLAVAPYLYLRSIGLILVTLVAGLTGGAGVGFLFGIPRVLSDAGPAPAPDAAQAGTPPAAPPRRLLASNSNLEEVSDWLTKIILGVSLTQLYRLNDLLLGFENLIALYVPPADQVTPVVTTIVLVFAVLCGFLTMYLETRLVLSRIFNSVEEVLAALTRQNAQIAVEKGDAVAVAAQLAGVVGQAPSSTLAASADTLKSAARSEQASPEVRSIAARALAASGRTLEADALLEANDDGTVLRQMTQIVVALYKEAPEGFEEALLIAGRLNGSDAARNSPEFWFLQAAAWGQKHHYLLGATGSAQDVQSARDNALDCARKCVALNPSYKKRLFWLVHPHVSPDPRDDDLVDFASDPDFIALVGTPEPRT